MGPEDIVNMLLESADRAEASGNTEWELDTRRVADKLAELKLISGGELPEYIGSNRFKLVSAVNGGLFIFRNGREVPLNDREFDSMRILTASPNQVVPTERIRREVKSRTYSDHLLGLKAKIGADVIILSQGRGVVFLPFHLPE